MTSSDASSKTTNFPIPTSLQELERSPYNLQPYPHDFEDDDEATRAESFDKLVQLVERGNRTLASGGMSLFETPEGEEGLEEWMDDERVQALYTLVRKSSSLAPATRSRLTVAVCEAVSSLSSILSSKSTMESDDTNTSNVVAQCFRDAFACHLYMLFSVMFFVESEAKVGNKVGTLATNVPKGKKTSAQSKKEKERKLEAAEIAASREACATAMLAAAKSMGKNKSRLWKRGVPDEDVVGLPCRIAYQMLESATGVVARKAASADEALGMLAATVDSADCLLSTVVAALVDLLHSFEHMPQLVAELCALVNEEPRNKLAVELLREIGRLNVQSFGGADGGKASGIKNIAPFISELAALRPHIVFTNISLVLPHLDSEPYVLRSSIVHAIGHILTRYDQFQKEENNSTNKESGEDDESRSSEVEKETQRRNKPTKSREALLDILTERAYDISSYTRVTVLKTWANLTEHQSLPLDRVMPVTALAIDRLQDKTVMVRRSAMQLLTLLLENNPFMGSLDPVPYVEKAKEIKSYLEANIPENIKEAQETALREQENSSDMSTEEINGAALAAAMAESEAMCDSDDMSESEIEFHSKVKALKFATSAIAFIGLFEHANRAFESMLLSSNASDVTEALRFFVRARHFKLPCAITGMKQALALMWSSETSIQDEVLKAFVDVFIAVPGTEGKDLLPDNQIAHNLLVLTGRATVSELASIEEAIVRLVKTEHIPAEVFMILWSVVSKSSGEARSAAMMVLSMGASADATIVDTAARLRLLLEKGMGDSVEEEHDWSTIRSAARALQRIARPDLDPLSARSIVLEQMIERLCAVSRGDWCVDENESDTLLWFSAAEQAIDAIFVVSCEPEKDSAEILRGLEASTFGFGQGERYPTCHSLRLSRFFFVLGHIALKLLVYTEEVNGGVRRANAAKSLAKQISVDKGNGNKSNGDDDGDIEDQLGVAAEAEAETERNVADIAEKEIVGRGLIGLFGPLLIRVVANEGGVFSSGVLMQSATLALCKFMCISGSFCEKHLPLLFTALSKAPSADTTLRANTVVALGDLAFRFPNAVEPYTPMLYACLRDKSTRVRRHTLMVMTHLILNDMVKVKGQVCEIALCLQDEEARIRDMARLLFHELSKRSHNPIYNLLPDIVSKLSQMGVKKEDFRNIMSFLLGFIKKERQNEMLVDKLCQRFPKCQTISQKADLAFCIAQLKINEKSIKCLSDLFKLYKDALFDEDVFKSFASIVTKAKKFAKPEMKQSLEEWEAKLSEHSVAGLENERAGNKAERAKARAAKRVAKRVETKKKTVQYEGESESEDELEESDDDEGIDKENSVNNHVAGKQRTSRSQRIRA